jgi:hypothetical protein
MAQQASAEPIEIVVVGYRRPSTARSQSVGQRTERILDRLEIRRQVVVSAGQGAVRCASRPPGGFPV